MPVTVALRPEKISLSREKPADAWNCAGGKIEELSYFGSATIYRLRLASGFVLSVSEANTARHRDDALTWGDIAWAHWTPQAHVVLTR